MPSKKKKYNARFPAGRIKKIMQTDEEIGKVAQAVPVIISRTLELFVKSLLTKAMHITNAKNAKTLSPSHMKQCILSESRFDFLKDLVQSLPDVSVCDEEGPSLPVCDNKIPPLIPLERENSSSGLQVVQDSRCNPSPEVTQPQTPPELPYRIKPNFYTETPEHQLMGVSYTPPVRPSTAVPQFPLSQIPKGGPLIVDEDYDSVE